MYASFGFHLKFCSRRFLYVGHGFASESAKARKVGLFACGEFVGATPPR